MSDLTEFLLARVAEDESMARDIQAGLRGSELIVELSFPQGDDSTLWRKIRPYDPARVLADCHARRAIIELHSRDHGCPDLSGMDGYTWVTAPRHPNCAVLRLFAQPFADHPDFDPAWRLQN